jgi:hypothetical protein
VTVPAALALLDPDQQAQAVDIGDLQGDYFGRSQPGTIGNTERRLVFEAGAGRCLDQSLHLVRAQHPRQPARIMHARELRREVGAAERDRKKKRKATAELFTVGGCTPVSVW